MDKMLGEAAPRHQWKERLDRARPTISVDCSLAFGDSPGECCSGGEANASCSSTDSMLDPPRIVMSSGHRPTTLDHIADALRMHRIP